MSKTDGSYKQQVWCATNNFELNSKQHFERFRRLIIIPFNVQIPENERRPAGELSVEFNKELPGIRQWVSAGLFPIFEQRPVPPPGIWEIVNG